MSQEIDFLAVQQVSKRFVSQPAIHLLHECFFESVNRFLAKLGNDSRRRSK